MEQRLQQWQVEMLASDFDKKPAQAQYLSPAIGAAAILDLRDAYKALASQEATLKELREWMVTAHSALTECRDELKVGDHTHNCVVTAIDCLAEALVAPEVIQ